MKPRCPICQIPVDAEQTPPFRPFCSPRCKQLDLKNWLEGTYRLPRELQPEDLEELSDEERAEVLAALAAVRVSSKPS